MVANMDQNGLEYPARHFGTEHYLNNIVGGGVGPWYTNINAIPLYTTPNNLYDADGDPAHPAQPRLRRRRSGPRPRRRSATRSRCSGSKYDFSMPLENPLRLDQVGSTPIDPSPQSVPAYLQSDIAKYSPVVDDNTGRTDQVSFIRDWGIPGTGSSAPTTPAPTSRSAATRTRIRRPMLDKPTLRQYAIYDTNDDTPEHLNYYASGTTHGPGGPESPSEGLKRALELPATWTSYVLANDATAARSQRAATRSRTSRRYRPSRSSPRRSPSTHRSPATAAGRPTGSRTSGTSATVRQRPPRNPP